MSVLVYPSGATYPTIIAASYPSSSLATRHVSGQPVGAYSGMVNSSTANPIFFNPAFFTTNAAFTNSIPAVSSQTNAPGNLLCYNQDTLIGPNDVVKISWFENGGNTRSGIINYSFSTITES
jgi:protein involved in polysaccharide export with SLBB domain